MMTLPVGAQASSEFFYGELDQWESIKVDHVFSEGGQTESIKAILLEDSLYLYVATQASELTGIFYIDTGTDPFGYLGRGLWGDTPRIDYKVEDSTLYSYDGTGFDESWRKLGSVEVTEFDNAFMARVELQSLKVSADQNVAVAFYNSGQDYLPAYGNTMVSATRPDTAQQLTVAAKDFWDSISPLATNLGSELSLHAVRDHQKLFVLVKGEELNPKNTYFIDTSLEGGYQSPMWIDSDINYKIENGTLYKFVGSSNSPKWEEIEEVYTYITRDAIVMSVDLSLLEVTGAEPLSVGYVNYKEHTLPGTNQGMLSVNAFVEQPLRENTVYPVEYHGILNNPYKGWAPDATGGPYAQPHRLVRAQILWSEIEPERGVFDWERFEAENNFAAWDSKDVSYVFRFRMDVPKSTPGQMDIPQWLYDMIDGDGTWYQTTEIGSGFSPNYANPILIAEHERLIKAIGERYNDDPRVAFIQLGSIGHWGEWHTWPSGSGEFPVESVANQYIQHYIDHLDQKMLGIRRPLEHASKNNFGLFNDRIGYWPTTEDWLFWINNGIDYDNWYNKRTYPESANPNFWHTAYSAGEFGSGNALMWLRDDTVVDTLEQVRLSHTSWIGPCSPAGVGNVPDLPNINTVLKTIGYRFVVESVTHEPYGMRGHEFDLEMVWNNKGIAPFYFAWPLEIGLVNSDGELVFQFDTSVDIRQWLPGRTVVPASFQIPSDLPVGEYTLVVSINDPFTGEPGVDLAIKGRRDDGRYELSTVEVR